MSEEVLSLPLMAESTGAEVTDKAQRTEMHSQSTENTFDIGRRYLHNQTQFYRIAFGNTEQIKTKC
jgi:hypothetical protein